MRRVHLLLAVALATLGTGCVEKSSGLTRTEREQLRQFVSESPTQPQHPLEVSFEDKITLIGYDVSPTPVTAGETLTITWHWRVDRAVEDGWKLFTHVTDDRGGNQLNEDGNGLIRQLYQPGQWKAGEFIKDTQEITIPEDWAGRRAVAYVGLWNGPNRMRILRGPSDGDNRARGPSVEVVAPGAGARAPQQPSVPSLDAPRAQGITLDGKLDEPAWAAARWTEPFVDTLSGGPAAFEAKAKVLWDDDNLYVAFQVSDDDLRSPFTEHDDHLWEADCVEVMVDPDGDGRNYFELQVSPRNVSFDTRYDSRRQPQPIGHADWDSSLRSAVEVRGDVDEDDDDDEGYTVEMAIPWAAFDAGPSPATRPNAGDTWRLNFYVMDARDGGQRANGWSPPRVRDFHVPARFGRVRFVDPTAQAPTPAAPTAETAMVARPAAPLIPAHLRAKVLRQIGNHRPTQPPRAAVHRPRPGEPIENLPARMTAEMAAP